MMSLGICVDLTVIYEIQEVFFALIMLSKNTEESRDLLACKAFLYNKINGKSTKFLLKINFKLEESWVNGLIDASENFHKKRSNIENVFCMPDLPQYLKFLGRTVFLWSAVLPAMIGA